MSLRIFRRTRRRGADPSGNGSVASGNPRVMKDGRSALSRGWRLLPRCLHYLRPYRKQAVFSILLTALLAALALAEPWPLAFIIDSVLGERPAPGWITGLVGDGSGALILFAVGGSLVITLLSGGLTVVNEYLTTTVDQRMVLDFRSDMFEHAQRLSLAYHDDTSTGLMMYRLNNQAGSLGAIVVALPDLAQSVLTIAGMAYVTYRIDADLALLALAVVPLVYFSTTYYANRIEPQLFRVRGMEAMNLSIVHEAIQMLRVVVTFGREKHEFQRFRKQGEQTVDARVNLTVRQTLFKLAVSFLTAVGTAAVLGVGAQQVLANQMTAGELLVIMSYVAAVYTPLESLTNHMATFQQQFIALEHALELLDTPIEVTDRPGAVPIGRATGALEFESVGFSYKSRPDTLCDISFSIPAGSSVALVGPTGAGKSTLVSLIPRLHDPNEGRILLDGRDLRDIKLESLRAQFSMVLQEPLLFSGTIEQNIRYGRPGASRDEVEDAARAANAHDFIAALPEGYATRLGERGTKISGGERQRVAVARAFLRDAPILILDEPTSSIDSRTEAVILDALERLMEGRTTIMIAHRLSTVSAADEVLVVNEGRIVQRGHHDELLASDGLYRQLWTAQSANGTNGHRRPRPGPQPDDIVLPVIHWRRPDDDGTAAEEPSTGPVATATSPIDEGERGDGLEKLRLIDHIVVVTGDRVVEVGNHDELIEAGGAYQQMWVEHLWRGRAGDAPSAGRRSDAFPAPRSEAVRSGTASPEATARLARIRSDDLIVVLVDGELGQEGTHDELMAAPGPYRDLHPSVGQTP